MNTGQGQTLLNAMLEARKTFIKSQADYYAALEEMLDSYGNADGVFIHKHEGRAYAQALTEYFNATMAFLAYTDPRSMPGNAQATVKTSLAGSADQS